MVADIRCSTATLASWSGEALAVGLFSGEAGEASRGQLLERFGAAVADRLEQRRFKGKPGESLSIDLLGQSPSLLVLVGLGAPADFGPEQLRSAAASASKSAANAGASQLALAMPVEGLAPEAAASAMAEAVRLSLYSDQRFKSDSDPQPSLSQVELLGLAETAQAAVESSRAVCSGVELARELVAAPPNVVTPAALADTAATIARDFGLELKVLERSDCEALGMGSYLAVAQGSDLPPKFIHLTYRPQGGADRRLVLVGKGLTFDSGGYNLKTAGSQIEMMKYDMGGSAAVLGAMRAIAELKPAGVEVHMIVAACEHPGRCPGVRLQAQTRCRCGSGHAHRRLRDRAWRRDRWFVVALRSAGPGPDRGRSPGRRNPLAHAPARLLPRWPQERPGRHEKHGPQARWIDHRRPVPAGLCGSRGGLGSPRHRRHGVER